MKLRRRRCFWLQMTPVSSQVPNCSLTAAERRSSRQIQREACANDNSQITSTGGNQFLGARLGESQQNIFKSHGRPVLERGRSWEEPSYLSIGTPPRRSRRHVPDSGSRRATAP